VPKSNPRNGRNRGSRLIDHGESSGDRLIGLAADQLLFGWLLPPTSLAQVPAGT
jgi:hypothetical protein